MIFNISGGKKINIKNLAKKFKNIFGNHNTKIVYKKIEWVILKMHRQVYENKGMYWI